MAALLPSTIDSFQRLGYWNEFYARRSIPFEWYGEYTQLASALHKYLKPKDVILQVGCGNSRFADDLYDNGVRDITSIDLVEGVIEAQRAKVKGRHSLVYEVMDATRLSYPASHFTAILDKGTLDALLPDSSQSALATAQAMFQECYRVLALFGRYIIISLAQEHVLECWVNFFKERNCLIRVHVTYSVSDESFVLPVFLLVVTKLKGGTDNRPKSFELAEINGGALALERFTSAFDLRQKIREVQLYCLMCKHLRESRLKEEVGLTLTVTSNNKECEFDTRIVDVDLKTPAGPYAVFVTPVGSETDYHFADPEGRKELAIQVGFSRVAILRLCSFVHDYKDVGQIKADLNTRVLDFAPRLCHVRNVQIPFLSAESDLQGAVTTLFTGESTLNGRMVVTDTWPNDQRGIRRLVFAQSQNLVQSEAAVTRRKGKKSQWTTVVDHENLLCAHHRAMLKSLQLHPKKDDLTVLIIGMGGGLLASHLVNHVPQVTTVEGVELDPMVLEIGRKYFALDDRVKVQVGCGAEYVKQCAAEGREFDIVMVDVAGDRYVDTVAAPVPAMLTDGFVEDLAAVCSGVATVNVITRSSSKRLEIFAKYQTLFPVIQEFNIPDEVNSVIMLRKSNLVDEVVDGLVHVKL